MISQNYCLGSFQAMVQGGEPRWSPTDSPSWGDRAESLEKPKMLELAEHPRGESVVYRENSGDLLKYSLTSTCT